MQDKKTTWIYRLIRWLVWLFSPRMKLEGAEDLPRDPVVFVGNHCQMYGPIAAEIYFPKFSYIWCAGQMMHWKEVHGYAYEDFWSFKPKAVRWLFKLVSYLITPLSVCVFNNARTIPVYRDTRIITTFRESIARLQEGANVVIFPEHNQKRNNVIYDFEDKFIDLARFYYRKSGKELCFVPTYIAPKLKIVTFGEPIRFRADAPIEEERQRIREYLMRQITEKAVSLPAHTVIPYRNVRKRDYPRNHPLEVYAHEETDS